MPMQRRKPPVRNRLIGKTISAVLTGMSNVARLHPEARPSRHDVRVVRDLPYRDSRNPAHLLDVYVPTRGEGPFPIVLHIHGGGFQILSKDTHFAMALAFARKGYVVFNINYRLAPQHQFPAALEDISHAFEWVVEHAARYHADTSRLFIAGESAGANLTTALTLMTVQQRPEPFAKRVFEKNIVPIGVLPACGILQVSNPERYEQKLQKARWLYDRIVATGKGYVGYDVDASLPEYALASPLAMLESDAKFARALPPFFAGVGTRDPLVDDTRRLGAALEKRGVPCEVQIYPGEIHAFHAFVWRPQAQQYWRDAYRFLDTRLAQRS